LQTLSSTAILPVMFYPPSLSEIAKARAFRATNGELGVLIDDVEVFLQACRSSGTEVLGWELWIVDHAWGEDNSPVPAEGLWCGGIPVCKLNIPSVIGGDGDVDETERQLAAFDIIAEVQPEWLPHVRVNFTLAE